MVLCTHGVRLCSHRIAHNLLVCVYAPSPTACACVYTVGVFLQRHRMVSLCSLSLDNKKVPGNTMVSRRREGLTGAPAARQETTGHRSKLPGVRESVQRRTETATVHQVDSGPERGSPSRRIRWERRGSRDVHAPSCRLLQNYKRRNTNHTGKKSANALTNDHMGHQQQMGANR